MPTPDQPALPEELPAALPFPVVGVGASAGGLEAITLLLQSLPGDPGLTLLVAMHLHPDFKSELPAILGRVTPMPVQQAADGMLVEINHVYIIPPGKSIALTDGHLALTARPPRGLNMPADHLFRSLATLHKTQAIGVVLSGEGTDGTLGFQAIKAEGGITFVQSDDSAKHHGMPRSAIADGGVDYVLPPEGIARELLRLSNHTYTTTVAAPVQLLPKDEIFGQLISLLRSSTDVDFTHYKQATIRRRIHRRMALRNLDDLGDYLKVLRSEPAELNNLYQDFLIRVTQFFRDPEAFEAVKEKAMPALATARSSGQPIRVWVAGCSTGEEVYSLAICLLEHLAESRHSPSIKILATDVNELALEKARAGLYIDNIELDVSPERLRRFFVRVDGHYQIAKSVRDLCVFSRHNMSSDPPFSHIDLVSCRNVLIYMDAALQRRVLPILHYALSPEGFLFLGGSESIGPFGELFQATDQRHRLFKKKLAATSIPLDFGTYVATESAGRRGRGAVPAVWSALDVQREADRIMLARFAPVGVIIDEMNTVLQFRGRTAPYLEPAPGMATLDLPRMLREGLLAEVRSAINQAKAENVVAARERLCLVEGTALRYVGVEVIPFKVSPSGARFFLVLFRDERPAPLPVEERSQGTEPQATLLQQELAALREHLQSVIEQQESTNEELKSANEEILSANEELQSTNEELQTAKEEAQSANEELATVNEELRHRNSELGRVNNDLINLLSGVSIPIVLVSRDLRIRRFTPLAEKVLNLIPSDVGRPIGDIKPNLVLDDLSRLIAGVIGTLSPHESEVRDRMGRWYLLRILPYVTQENLVDGASVALLDIDRIKEAVGAAD